MIIEVRFYASCREQVGLSVIQIQLADGATTADAICTLLERYPVLRNGANDLSFAVNRKYVREPISLSDGDVLALIPPVSGG